MSDEVSPERPAAGSELAKQGERSLSPKQVGSAALVAVVAVFAVLNLQDVTMHWIVGTTHTPLIVLIAFCVLVGVAIGYVVGRRTRAEGRGSSKKSG